MSWNRTWYYFGQIHMRPCCWRKRARNINHRCWHTGTILVRQHDTILLILATVNSHVHNLSNPSHNWAAFFNKENQPLLEKGDASKGSRQVLCSRCNTYIKLGSDHTLSSFHKHQNGRACKVGFAGVFLLLFLIFWHNSCNRSYSSGAASTSCRGLPTTLTFIFNIVSGC